MKKKVSWITGGLKHTIPQHSKVTFVSDLSTVRVKIEVDEDGKSYVKVEDEPSGGEDVD